MTRITVRSAIQGIFPPVVTPFSSLGVIDEGKYRENVQRYTGVGLGGVVVAGSTGEAPYLTRRERLRLTELARKIIRPPEILIVGTGLESTQETILLSREAAERGADAVLILTPGYYRARMNSALLTAHYRKVADSMNRPIIIYNIPQFTGIRMEPVAIADLSRHPNIAGLKESSGDLNYLREIIQTVKKKGRKHFRVLSGSAIIQLEALREGAAGGVLGQANFAPELCVGLYEAYAAGQGKLAEDLQRRLLPLAHKISTPFGVAGVKAALDCCGYHGGPPRSPLRPLNAAERRLVAAALKEARAGLDQ